MKPQDINWNPLFAWINQTLGTEVEFSMDFSGKRPTIVCPNLFNNAGIFKTAFKEIEVGFFGFWETKNENNEVIGFSGCVNLFYRHWGGGSNGAEIGMFWFEDGKWKFESERVRYSK